MPAHTGHEKINYVEFAARDPALSKAFFRDAFGWEFTDYGGDYTAFAAAGLDGGFYRADLCSAQQNGGALVVLYSRDLDATRAKIERAGGVICKPVFAFPGGRRFHFTEPCGNEFAVWSDA